MNDDAEMQENYNKMVEGAKMLGFVDAGNNTYICTKEQIIALCVIVARETAKQALEEMME